MQHFVYVNGRWGRPAAREKEKKAASISDIPSSELIPDGFRQLFRGRLVFATCGIEGCYLY
jgi:hypothetical protein